jgi:hypothetical protein
VAEKWYYSREGQQRGPLTPTQIKELVAAGKLTPTDLIWKEGLESWIPASRLKGLFSEETLAESGAQESQLAVNTGARTMTARAESDHPAAIAWRLLVSTLGVCCKRLPSVVFVTVIWYVASLFALSFIITAPLAMAFTLGYVTIISQIIRREPFSLNDFVSFFRYGWNSLFYLYVLLACAFVILSVAVLSILAGMWFFGVITAVMDSLNLAITISAAFGLILSSLYFAFVILLFCLFMQVTTSSPSEDRPFDFIYDAFGNTMTILSKRWRTLGFAGLFLSLFYMCVISLLFTGMKHVLVPLVHTPGAEITNVEPLEPPRIGRPSEIAMPVRFDPSGPNRNAQEADVTRVVFAEDDLNIEIPGMEAEEVAKQLEQISAIEKERVAKVIKAAKTQMVLGLMCAFLAGMFLLFLGTFSNVFFVSTANYLVAKTEPENGTDATNA